MTKQQRKISFNNEAGNSSVKFDNLSKYRLIHHFCSTRHGGLKFNEYKFVNGEYNEHQIISTLHEHFDADSRAQTKFVLPHQTHSKNVLLIDDSLFKAGQNLIIPQNVDAMITNQKGICIAVKTADCVPILLFDPKALVIAAIHAGWRGTWQNIVGETVQKMKHDFGSNPENIIAGIGPSISSNVYEVGNEVISAFKNWVVDFETFTSNTNGTGDRTLLNLWEANRQLLLHSGLLQHNIEIIGECTYSNSSKYFSARRDSIDTGRQVSGIMITNVQ